MRREAQQAAVAFGGKMRAKLTKLETPVADRREEDERQTLLEQHKQKLSSWAASEAAIAEAVADPHGSVGAVCAAAAEVLSEALDVTLGAAVTDHAIFNAHSRRYEAEFVEDLASLHIRMPDALTRVTEYLEKVPDKGTYNPIVDYVVAIVAKVRTKAAVRTFISFVVGVGAASVMVIAVAGVRASVVVGVVYAPWSV